MQRSFGVIFIDCWEIVGTSAWPQQTPNFDFYNNMTQVLHLENASSLVFHTGTFGNLPLSQQLVPWHKSAKATDIMNIEAFKQHYTENQIYDWLVVGAHWQRCTHDKPLGFKNLMSLKQLDQNLRVFSVPECTACFVWPDSQNDNIDNPICRLCVPTDYQTDILPWNQQGSWPELSLQ